MIAYGAAARKIKDKLSKVEIMISPKTKKIASPIPPKAYGGYGQSNYGAKT